MPTCGGVTYYDIGPESGQLTYSEDEWSGRRRIVCPWDDSITLMIALTGTIIRVGPGTYIVKNAANYPPDGTLGGRAKLIPKRITRERYLGTPEIETSSNGPKGSFAIITIEYGEQGLVAISESASFLNEILVVHQGIGVKYAASASAAVQGKSIGQTIAIPLSVVLRSFHFEGVPWTVIEKLQTSGGGGHPSAAECINHLNSDVLSIPRAGRADLIIPANTALFQGCAYKGRQLIVYSSRNEVRRETLFDLDIAFKCRGVTPLGGSLIQGWNQVYCAQTKKWEDIEIVFPKLEMMNWTQELWGRAIGLI